LPPILGVLMSSGFHRFENGIEVERIAELHELFAQVRNMDATRNIDDHLHREHRRARVSRGIAAGGDLRNIDTAAGEKAGQSRHDAGLIEADHINGVGEHVRARRTGLGALQMDAEIAGFSQALELGFELRQRMPVARDEQQHRELGTEARHATLTNIAAALTDHARQLVNHPGAVTTDRRNGQVLLHLRVVLGPSIRNPQSTIYGHCGQLA